MAYEPKKLTPAELAELHALPDDALSTPREAAAFLRLKYNTLSWYRCNGGGPAFVRVGPKLIRYRMGDLREYMKGQPMGEGVQRAAQAMLAARTANAEVKESQGIQAANPVTPTTNVAMLAARTARAEG